MYGVRSVIDSKVQVQKCSGFSIISSLHNILHPLIKTNYMANALTSLVGREREGGWSGSVTGVNSSIYGNPNGAHRVEKFNLLDKSITHIGPDFDDGVKWCRAAMADNGIIYCASKRRRRGILKIDTNTNTVTELDSNLLPERGEHVYDDMWRSCAAALDGWMHLIHAVLC